MSAASARQRRAHRKRARQGPGAVTLAETPWTPPPAPPQDNTPTPERMAKGDWTIGKATGAHRCTRSIRLYNAHANGHITGGMKAAGDAYLALRMAAVKIHGGSLQRDSLDLMPRGGGETSPEYSARIKERDRECTKALTVIDKGRVSSLQGWVEAFVVQNTALGKYDMRYRWWQGTTAGLRALVVFFGLPDD